MWFANLSRCSTAQQDTLVPRKPAQWNNVQFSSRPYPALSSLHSDSRETSMPSTSLPPCKYCSFSTISSWEDYVRRDTRQTTVRLAGPRVTNQWNCSQYGPKIDFRAISVPIGHDLLFMARVSAWPLGQICSPAHPAWCVTNIWSKNYSMVADCEQSFE